MHTPEDKHPLNKTTTHKSHLIQSKMKPTSSQGREIVLQTMIVVLNEEPDSCSFAVQGSTWIDGSVPEEKKGYLQGLLSKID